MVSPQGFRVLIMKDHLLKNCSVSRTIGLILQSMFGQNPVFAARCPFPRCCSCGGGAVRCWGGEWWGWDHRRLAGPGMAGAGVWWGVQWLTPTERWLTPTRRQDQWLVLAEQGWFGVEVCDHQ